jgi:hypothetical protein
LIERDQALKARLNRFKTESNAPPFHRSVIKPPLPGIDAPGYYKSAPLALFEQGFDTPTGFFSVTHPLSSNI